MGLVICCGLRRLDDPAMTDGPPSEQRDDSEDRRSLRLVALAWLWLGVAIPGLFWLVGHPTTQSANVGLAVGVFVLMLAAELFPIDVELRRESHSFSFSNGPLLVGVLLLPPVLVVALRLCSSAIVLFGVLRQSPVKLAINVLAHLMEVVVAAAVLTAILPVDLLDTSAWALVFGAIVLSDLASAAVITTAISVAQGHWERGLISGTSFGAAAGLVDAAVAILIVTLFRLDRPELWLVLAMGAVIVLLTRAYSRVSARYRSMELLDRFTRAIGAAVLDGTAAERLLTEAADILHADAGWLVVKDSHDVRRIEAGENGPVACDMRPIDHAILARATVMAGLEATGGALFDELAEAGLDEVIFCEAGASETRTVVLVVADRSGSVRAFDEADAELLQTLAVHAGLALLNIDLVDRLRDEITTTEFQATHDALTGLPNRVLFKRRLEASLALGEAPAVMLIDLDRFKDVNDTLGHHNGDRLLAEIGKRLRQHLGAQHTVARLGGDEFAAFIGGVPDRDGVISSAFDLAAHLEQAVTIAGVEVDVGASIGVAFASEENRDADTLLRQADVAMYTAKADRSQVEEYAPTRDNYSPQRLSLVGRLRNAIDNGELTLHYQPQIDLARGAVIGAEALARWPQPGRDPIPPDEFIHIAEHTGLIRPLSRLVLDLAVAQAVRWHRQGRFLRVSLNLSPHNLIEPGIVAAVADTLNTHGLDPRHLMIELTETTVMANPERTMRVISELRELGTGLAIDDFGTGHSSLAYLTTLPATELKVDKSFVLSMATEPAARSVVRSIVDLGRSLDLDVIAEGVETESAAAALTKMGCALGQGYFYSRPLEPRAFERWQATYDSERDQRTNSPTSPVL